MGWTKILNKSHKREERILSQEELEDCLRELSEEVNFRLLCEEEKWGELLWIQEITVTAYQTEPKEESKKKPSLAGRLKDVLQSVLKRGATGNSRKP